MQPIFLIFSLGTPELIVLGIVGLLLFGRRLPEVGRSLGKTFVEFKSGLNDMKDELRDVDRLVDEQAEQRAPRPVDATYRDEPEDEFHDHDHEQEEAPSDDEDASKS